MISDSLSVYDGGALPLLAVNIQHARNVGEGYRGSDAPSRGSSAVEDVPQLRLEMSVRGRLDLEARVEDAGPLDR